MDPGGTFRDSVFDFRPSDSLAAPLEVLFVRRVGAWDSFAALLDVTLLRRVGAWDSLKACLEAFFVRRVGAWDSFVPLMVRDSCEALSGTSQGVLKWGVPHDPDFRY